jgi:hypothetical protein
MKTLANNDWLSLTVTDSGNLLFKVTELGKGELRSYPERWEDNVKLWELLESVIVNSDIDLYDARSVFFGLTSCDCIITYACPLSDEPNELGMAQIETHPDSKIWFDNLYAIRSQVDALLKDGEIELIALEIEEDETAN